MIMITKLMVVILSSPFSKYFAYLLS